MSIQKITIRRWEPDDNSALRQVFFSSVHGLAGQFYSKNQINAWATKEYDPKKWAAQMALLKPFIAEVNGHIAGYADLQPTGLIDHFFVAKPFASQGVGTALMRHIFEQASERKLPRLYAFVSLGAESFFAKFGFEVEARQSIAINGSALQNAMMAKYITRQSH